MLAVLLHGIRDDKKIGGLQLVVYADIDSIKPRMQVFVSNLTDSSKWKLCADASVHNAHKAKVRLKTGLYSSVCITGMLQALKNDCPSITGLPEMGTELPGLQGFI